MLQELQNLVPNHEKKGVTEKIIADFEQKLELTFGDEFKAFLQEYGYLCIDSLEFYGICEKNNAIPSAIHATLSMREQIPTFPKNLIVFFEYGDGSCCCVDSKDQVYLCEYDRCNKLNQTFKNFIIQTIKQR